MVLSYLDRVREAVEDESVVRPVVTACAAALSPRIGTGSAEGPVMDALLIALLASAFAEMGDRTQLLAMVLALRFRNDPAVLSAIMLATIVNCAVSAAGGWLLAGFIGTSARTLFFALSFLFAGAGMLMPVQRPDDVGGWRIGAFFTSFFALFILGNGRGS